MMTTIPKEVYTMDGYEERDESKGRFTPPEVKLYMVARPGVDMSDLVLEEYLGEEGEVTKEQILEAQERLRKQARENAWKFLQELVKEAEE